jgi:uncharacterized membrane protein YeiB
MNQAAAPVLQKERIDVIDSLRGVAIPGILLVNTDNILFGFRIKKTSCKKNCY